MKHYRYILILISSIILVSCGSDEPFKHVVFADSPKMFSAVVDLTEDRSPVVMTEGVSYYITFNDEPKQATLTINDLRLTPSGERVVATFVDLEWTYGEGAHEKQRIIVADELHSSGDPGADMVLTDVTFVYTESNELNPVESVGFYAEFTVNGRYHVVSYPYLVVADGTTTIRGVAEGRVMDDEISYDPVYLVRFDPKSMSASVSSLGLTIGGINADFEISGLGLVLDGRNYALSANGTTDYKSVSDESRWSFVDFNATADLRDELNLVLELSSDSCHVVVEGFLSPDLSVSRR